MDFGLWTVVVVVLLAYALRVYHLDYQASLSDDAFSLTLAREPPWDAVRVSAREPHPPVYYVLLSAWHAFAGDREFAGRYTGLFFGVLCVPVAWALGRRLFGRPAGLAAAFLVAVNPFLVDFSQTARMYTMVVFLVFCSLWMAYRCQRGLPPWRLVALYAAVSLLAMATHFFAFFIILAEDLAALLLAARCAAWWKRWIVGQAIIGLVYLPWVIYAWQELFTYTNTLVSSKPLAFMLRRSLTVFAIGWGKAQTAAAGLALLEALLCLAGLAALALLWRRSPRASAFLAAQLVAPFVIVWAVSLFRPMFYERYMVVAWPAYAILAGAGLALWGRLARPLAALATLALGLCALGVLTSYYQTVLYARSSDMRALVAYTLSAPDPAVIVSVPPSDPFYRYYFPRTTTIVYSSTLGLPDAGSASESLEAIAAGHPFVWFLPFANATWDPHGFVYSWLSSHTYAAGSRWFGNAQVIGYAAGQPLGWRQPAALEPPLLLGPSPDAPLVALRGARLGPPEVALGAPLYLLLEWEGRAPVSVSYNVFVHVVDGSGRLVGQQDGQPQLGLRPTQSWKPGEVVLDRHAVAAAWPAGELKVLVGLYDPADGKRLAFRLPSGQTGDAFMVGTARPVLD